MKKIFLLTFLALLMIGLVTAGPGFPHPVYGEITQEGDVISNIEVKVFHEHSGVSEVVKTDKGGYYQAELSNFGVDYRDGDWLKISLVYCESQERCQRRIQVSGGGSEVSFDIAFSEVLPVDVEVLKYVCWDKSVVSDLSNCPVEPKPVIIQKKECSDGSLIEESEDCPEEEKSSMSIILGILSALLAIALGILSKFRRGKGFVGLVKYYKRKGYEAWKDGDKELAAKHYKRAAKMVGTAIDKATEGKY